MYIDNPNPNDSWSSKTILTPEECFYIRTTWMLFTLGSFFAFLRISIKLYLHRRLGREEYAVLFSLACWTSDTFSIPFIIEYGTNSMPEHRRAKLGVLGPATMEWERRVMASKLFVMAWMMYITMIWALKCSILWFYERITNKLREQKLIKYAWWILGITWAVCELQMLLVCRPFRANWQIWPNPGRQCTEGHEYVWIVGVLNISTDIMLLMIPLPIVFRLQASLSRKILLGCLFGLGFFVIIATILRMYFTITGGKVSTMAFWSMVETCTGMIVANLPGIRAIFTKFRHKASLTSSTHDQKKDTVPMFSTELFSNIPGIRKYSPASSNSNITPNTALVFTKSFPGQRPQNVAKIESRKSTELIVLDEKENKMTIHKNVEYVVS